MDTGDNKLVADDDKLDINDPHLEEKLVNRLKEQGVFDQLRKEYLADVDTKVKRLMIIYCWLTDATVVFS